MTARLAPVILLSLLFARSRASGESCCFWAEEAVERVRAASFAELAGKDIRIRQLNSKSDYLQARFDVSRFLTGRRMRYLIFINPRLDRQALSAAAVNAIIAHELAHVAHYAKGSRFRLFGLAGLISAGRRSRFERRADREAIRRGHGAGLKEFRQWLYVNVPASALKGKRRDYLSPEEIDAMMRQPD